MQVDLGDKTLKIQGEMYLDNTFVAYINSIKNWESPNNTVIGDKEREEIIRKISDYRNNLKFKIIFE